MNEIKFKFLECFYVGYGLTVKREDLLFGGTQTSKCPPTLVSRTFILGFVQTFFLHKYHHLSLFI